MNQNKHCNELLKVFDIMTECLRSSVYETTEEILNHSFAKHKMTIAQMAVHTMSWPKYFLSEQKPWKVEKFTCRPCVYPITLEFINSVIDDGYNAISEYLNSADDERLNFSKDGQKGKGYLIYRLLIHIMVHAEQIALLRSILEPDWKFSKQFGKMSTALIGISFHTDKDPMFRDN